MTRFAFYIGIGLLCHLLLIGTVFNPVSIWTYVVILAWPLAWVAFLGGALAVGLAALLIVFVVIALCAWLQVKMRDRRRLRDLKHRTAGFRS
jgi:membrane protein implicated in regulation of membrane protease activity